MSKLRDDIKQLVKKYYEEEVLPTKALSENENINYAGRIFDEKELCNLVDSSLDFWLTEGRFSKEFVKRLSVFYDNSHILLTNSGSSANLLAISALSSPLLGDKRLSPGDEIITVAAGFPSTLAPIIQNNFVPVFVDVDLETYNISTDDLESAITDKTKAIFVAHTLGNPFDLEKIMQLSEKYGLFVIEDNCDAMGSLYHGKLTGTFGHIATCSFYPAHHITTGEGGCVITKDKLFNTIIKSLRDWGRDCHCDGGMNNSCGHRFSGKYGDLPDGYDHKYVYSHIGYNLKMTEMQASIGCAQMDKIAAFTERRIENFNYLFDRLKQFEQYFILPKATKNSIPSWFCFIITVRENEMFTRDNLVHFLNSKKIETRNLFAGNLLKQPAFIGITHRTHGHLINTNLIMNNTFFIGTYPGMTRTNIDFIITIFDEFFSKYNLRK